MKNLLRALRAWFLLSPREDDPTPILHCRCGREYDPQLPGVGVVVNRFSDSVGSDEIHYRVFSCGLCGDPLNPEGLWGTDDEDEFFRPVDHTDVKGPDRSQWGVDARKERGAL